MMDTEEAIMGQAVEEWDMIRTPYTIITKVVVAVAYILRLDVRTKEAAEAGDESCLLRNTNKKLYTCLTKMFIRVNKLAAHISEGDDK